MFLARDPARDAVTRQCLPRAPPSGAGVRGQGTSAFHRLVRLPVWLHGKSLLLPCLHITSIRTLGCRYDLAAIAIALL
jgi:hypothetical protein